MGQLCAVSFNRYGRLFYLDPGEFRPAVGDQVLVPTDDGPEVAECVWAPQWVRRGHVGVPAPGRPGRTGGPAPRRAHPARQGRGQGGRQEADPRARPADEGGRGRPRAGTAAAATVREATGVAPPASAGPHDDLLHRAAPGRLPLAGPRPRRHPALPGGAAAALGPRLGPGAGRHRLVRAGPVLRDVPDRLRAGDHPDGQGPGSAAQPAAHLRRVWAADVLPEVRASAVPDSSRRPRRRSGDGSRTPEGPAGSSGTACRGTRSSSGSTPTAPAARAPALRCAARARRTRSVRPAPSRPHRGSVTARIGGLDRGAGAAALSRLAAQGACVGRVWRRARQPRPIASTPIG